MPSKKPNQSAKKPGKALPKKATPKAAAPKKVAHPTTKPKLHPKPVLTKVAVKSTKPVSKPTAAKPAVKAPSRAKSPPNGELVPKPDAAEAPEKSAPIKFDIRPMVLPRAAPLNEEDGEFEPPTTASLLAGPRNVKPYIARRGEQYMNKEQLEHFARILQNWKRDLMVEVDRTVLHMKDEAANFPDPNDRATQ